MIEFAHVNPANVADISLVDFPPGGSTPLVSGNFVYLPKAPDGGTLIEAPVGDSGANVGWDIYPLVRSTAQPPGPLAYYTPVETYEFRNAADTAVGIVGDSTSQVIETRAYTEIPIADLYRIKRSEINAQDDMVRFNALDTALNANWWLILVEKARFSLESLGLGAALWKAEGTPWPTGPNAPFVGIYNASTMDVRRFKIDQATWEALLPEWASRDQATDAATDASRTSLDTKYNDGAGDWQAVADHDAADAVWNYPPTVDPNELRVATQ